MTTPPGRRIVAALARLVPPSRRDAWRREWEAELSHAAWRLEREGRGAPSDRWRLRLRALASVRDAFWMWRETMMTGLWNEVRFAVRGLLRNPAFTAVAVLTLALGIGANTAVFTLVDGVVLSPLPFPGSDRLVAVSHLGRGGQDELPVSTGLYLVYRDHARSLGSIALHSDAVVNLVGDGEPERVQGQTVTPSFFEVLRVPPALGRTLAPEDGREGAEPVVVLSHGLWRDRFGSDAGAVGSTVDMDGVTRRVVGVMPEGFAYPDERARLYIPLVIDELNAPTASFSADGIARLADDVTVEAAGADLAGLIDRLPELRPDDPAVGFLREVGLAARVDPLKERIVGDLTRTLWVLLGTVGFVLLIACANVANLLLVRAEGRQRELALRLAVGAGRGAVVRPFLAESLALGVAGGALGVAVAALAVRTAAALAPADLPRMAEVGVDLRVLGFTALVALGSALVFGLFPVIRYGRPDLTAQLKEGGGGRGGSGGRETHRLRNGLVVTQVALALVLLVGSGLMLRSFLALRSVDAGFDDEGVLTVRLTVPQGEVADAAGVDAFFRQLRDRLEGQPGLTAVGSGSGVPLTGQQSFGGHDIEDHPRQPDEIPAMASFRFADPGFFEALGIPLREGRAFRTGDGADGFRGVVVSEAYARRWWPGGSALGKRVRQGPGDAWWEVVGVAADVHYAGLEAPPEEMVYFPTLVGPAEGPFAIRSRDVVVKVASDAASFLPVLRREVWALNPRIPLANPRTMRDVREQAAARTSFTVVMLGAASGVALLLGMVGIYGVISYVVTQRTREIGVRMALGASAPVVRRMVLRQGVTLAAVGVGLGLLVALALSSVMASLLFGVSATDPATYAVVAVALAGVAALASWLPALRASGVEPSVALRRE